MGSRHRACGFPYSRSFWLSPPSWAHSKPLGGAGTGHSPWPLRGTEPCAHGRRGLSCVASLAPLIPGRDPCLAHRWPRACPAIPALHPAAANALAKHRGAFVGVLVQRPMAEDAVTGYLRALSAEAGGTLPPDWCAVSSDVGTADQGRLCQCFSNSTRLAPTPIRIMCGSRSGGDYGSSSDGR